MENSGQHCLEFQQNLQCNEFKENTLKHIGDVQEFENEKVEFWTLRLLSSKIHRADNWPPVLSTNVFD